MAGEGWGVRARCACLEGAAGPHLPPATVVMNHKLGLVATSCFLREARICCGFFFLFFFFKHDISHFPMLASNFLSSKKEKNACRWKHMACTGGAVW